MARLTTAAVEELRAAGFDGLTVRNVARRAGLAPATAYTYFASKEHLVAEVYWQRLRALPTPEHGESSSPADRVGRVLAQVGLLVADEPELSAACTVAVLANDPDVRRLRGDISRRTSQMLVAALGPDADAATLRTLGAVFSGVLLQAGIGQIGYDEVPGRLLEASELVLTGRPVRAHVEEMTPT